jgi:hypothetical protein
MIGDHFPNTPFWCVGIVDVRSRKPCGRRLTPSPPLPAGWQPLCGRCVEALRGTWAAERYAEVWNARVRNDVVYIAGRGRFFKVGKSERGEVLRVRLVRLANEHDQTIRPAAMTPGPLELLAAFPGSYDEERQLQGLLKARGFGAGGEWFKRTQPSLRVAIRWLLEDYWDTIPEARQAEVDARRLIAEAPEGRRLAHLSSA